jgi:repressor LexA
MKELTKRQSQVFGFIIQYLGERGYPPTIREIGSRFGFGPRAAKEHLDALEKKGQIQRKRGARRIEILSHARARFDGIPVVGRVAAGTPVFSEENISGHLKIDDHLFPFGEFFFLKVSGDSMKGSAIRDGDHVLVRRQKYAESGEIVVARINDEATVKRFSIKRGKISLVPDNPEFSPIDISIGDDFEILGRVVGVWRRI